MPFGADVLVVAFPRTFLTMDYCHWVVPGL